MEINNIFVAPAQLLCSFSRSNRLLRPNYGQAFDFHTEVHLARICDGRNCAALAGSPDRNGRLSLLFVGFPATMNQSLYVGICENVL